MLCYIIIFSEIYNRNVGHTQLRCEKVVCFSYLHHIFTGNLFFTNKFENSLSLYIFAKIATN